MISREKYLLDCLAEECNEVAIRASKAIRFGLNEKQPGQDLDNGSRINIELEDLMAVVEMLNDECGLSHSPIHTARHLKRAKVNKFYQYSVERGEAEPLQD